MKEIYVELTSKLKDQMDKKPFIMPSGINMQRKKGSKSCYFECEDDQFDGLVELVEGLGLAWQDNSNNCDEGIVNTKDNHYKRK